MSLILFFGMVSIIIILGIATIVSTLLQLKRAPSPEAAAATLNMQDKPGIAADAK